MYNILDFQTKMQTTSLKIVEMDSISAQAIFSSEEGLCVCRCSLEESTKQS